MKNSHRSAFSIVKMACVALASALFGMSLFVNSVYSACPYTSDINDECNGCHSPYGSYDGVALAKASWDEGVYGPNGCLKPGKENWCISCHDEDPASFLGVTAPNVSLFYESGHGRPSAKLKCLDCHNATSPHVDGVARTYSFSSEYYDPSQSGVSYADGYRLRYIQGKVPLMIPTNYGTTFGYNAVLMMDTAFRLCFDCHDSSTVLDNTPGNGIDSNFKASLPNPPRNYSYAWGSGADVNEHVAHIMNYVGPFADSDWDFGTDGPGGTDGRDTLTTCSSCHNVHGAEGAYGSTNEAMIRDGRLVDRDGYEFSYVIEDVGSGGYPMVGSTSATQLTSIGAIFRNNTANMCGGSMCHGNPDPPPGSYYDAAGSSWGTYLEYYRPGSAHTNFPGRIDDVCDMCPEDPDKMYPDICGCGVAETDSDNDGTADCNDGCLDDPNKTASGVCGCGVSDTDSDSDGTPDCIDNCPIDPNNDADGDGVCGDVDNCPDVSNSDQHDSNGDGTGDACDTAEEPSPEEQMVNILAFFDQSVEEGNLEGLGKRPWLVKLRLRLMKKMLTSASFFLERGRSKAACWVLRRAFKRCDSHRRPTDYVIGDAVSELANMIKDLRVSLDCK